MKKTIIYQVNPDDLKTFFDEEFFKKDMNTKLNEFLKRFENIFVGVSEVATIHQISGQTVRNYITDGLIKPELRTIEGGKFQFQLSYVLNLNFEELKKQIRAKK